jgi:hypothetical protein
MQELKHFASKFIPPRIKYTKGIIVMKTSVDPRFPNR